MKIYFDMDGTIADLYGVEDWLKSLRASNPRPYKEAKPLVNMSRLARLLNKAQKSGVIIGIISWLSKNATDEYNDLVAKAKKQWLDKHLHSVKFDEIYIVPYGTPKHSLVDTTNAILFDDEPLNRVEWSFSTETARGYDVDDILTDIEELINEY